MSDPTLTDCGSFPTRGTKPKHTIKKLKCSITIRIDEQFLFMVAVEEVRYLRYILNAPRLRREMNDKLHDALDGLSR